MVLNRSEDRYWSSSRSAKAVPRKTYTDEQTRIDLGRNQTAGNQHHEHEQQNAGESASLPVPASVAEAALQKLGIKTVEQQTIPRTNESIRCSEIAILSRRTSTMGFG